MLNGTKYFHMAFRKLSPRINRLEKGSKTNTRDKSTKSSKAPIKPLRGVVLPNRANTLSLDSTDSPFILDVDQEDEGRREQARSRRSAAIAKAVGTSEREVSNGKGGSVHDSGTRCLSALMSARAQVSVHGIRYHPACLAETRPLTAR